VKLKISFRVHSKVLSQHYHFNSNGLSYYNFQHVYHEANKIAYVFAKLGLNILCYINWEHCFVRSHFRRIEKNI